MSEGFRIFITKKYDAEIQKILKINIPSKEDSSCKIRINEEEYSSSAQAKYMSGPISSDIEINISPLEEGYLIDAVNDRVGDKYFLELLRNCFSLLEHEIIHWIQDLYLKFNQEIEMMNLSEGGDISIYSLTDLVAEKYRAILQQEVRNRYRRQDIYDLYYLLTKIPVNDNKKQQILNSLLKKSSTRDLKIEKKSMRKSEIVKRTQKEYDLLKQEILGDLPDFNKVYSLARDFYESLPWSNN